MNFSWSATDSSSETISKYTSTRVHEYASQNKMALLQVILFLLMAPSGLALTSPPPRQQLTMGTGFNDPALMRRSFFAKSFSLAAGMGVIAAPNRADAKELGLAPVSQLYDELVDLKAQVHDGLKGTPVKRVVENTLEPMQRAMEKNPNNVQADTTRALELKGHMFELAQAVNICIYHSFVMQTQIHSNASLYSCYRWVIQMATLNTRARLRRASTRAVKWSVSLRKLSKQLVITAKQ